MSQIIRKFITNDAVDGTKIHLNNNQSIRARNAANSADVDIVKLDASNVVQLVGAVNASGAITASNLSGSSSGTNTGNVTLAAVGATPNANGASLSGQVLNLQPFNSTNPGVVTASGGGTTNFLRADGTWASPSTSGFATTSLNNLASTAVNADIIPDSDTVWNLGTAALPWNFIFVGAVVDSGGNSALAVDLRQLYDPTSVLAIDFSIRQLYNSAAAVMLDWSTAGLINVNNNLLSNVLDPVSAQDAATKAYVDSMAAPIHQKELTVLSSGDITNQYVDLANVAKTDSIDFVVKGGPMAIEGASYDYSVSYTGGAGGNTRITFLNDLATGGLSALVAGDVVVAKYQY